MKKLILIIFILLPSLSFAQIWYIGGKAGATFSNYKSQTPWKEVANVGYAAGLTAFKQINTNIGLGLEFQYIQKGYYHKICNTITDRLDANYLEIPISFDYTFLMPGLKNFKGHANLGVYTAYWVSAKYAMEGFEKSSESFDFKKNRAKRFDLGPTAGARLEYILKNGSLSLDCRYELGLMDMQKKETDPMKNTNRAFVVGLNYMKILNF